MSVFATFLCCIFDLFFLSDGLNPCIVYIEVQSNHLQQTHGFMLARANSSHCGKCESCIARARRLLLESSEEIPLHGHDLAARLLTSHGVAGKQRVLSPAEADASPPRHSGHSLASRYISSHFETRRTNEASNFEVTTSEQMKGRRWGKAATLGCYPLFACLFPGVQDH